MGPKLSNPNENKDLIIKLEKSAYLLAQRKKRKEVLSSMFKRVLSSKTPKSSTNLASLPENGILLILEFIPNDLKYLLSVSSF
jgi:hypothetical protein